MKKLSVFGLFALLTLLTFTNCRKKKGEVQAEPFQKATILSNVGTNLILPGYNSLSAALVNLESSYIQFSSSLSIEDFEQVKLNWKTAYSDFQKVKTYAFGPAKDQGLASALGTFPTDTSKVENNIASGSYNLYTSSNLDAIGFSALDFLFYRNEALSYFNTNAAYRNYALDVIQKMKIEVSTVVKGWNSSYLTSFKASTGTESTSAFSVLINEYTKDYEICKNTKLGVPIGKQSLGLQRPEYIEARYSGISLELLEANVNALQLVFLGNTLNSSGISFDDYLLYLNKETLSNTIHTQFTEILKSIRALEGTLEVNMLENTETLDNLYTKIQNLVVSIKTDMPSAFGVLITYQDNDGD
jgi:predicted lipoprotein